MGITRSICRIHGLVAVLVLLACTAASAWAFVNWISGRMETLAELVTSKYDRYLPEISIKDGEASIDKEQPYFIDLGTWGDDVVLVIDTRPEGRGQVKQYLGKTRNGAALLQDRLVVKNGRQIRVIQLKDINDLVINSASIATMIKRYLPKAEKALGFASLVYYLFAKTFQALLLALIPFLGARIYSVSLSYGHAFKVATFAMIPPVVLDLLVSGSLRGVSARILAYFAVYLFLLILATLDLVKNRETPASPHGPIAP